MQKVEPKRISSWWSWKIDEVELKNQISNYHKLTITESYRGISVLIISALLVFSFSLSVIGLYSDIGSMLWSLVIYAPILYFVYKGHRWAIITLMALWTLEKGYQLYQIADSGSGGGLVPIFWWLIIMPYFWKALRIENERKKISGGSVTDKSVAVFCRECGTQQRMGDKFCSKCGTKLLS